jgi:hypothetical protein
MYNMGYQNRRRKMGCDIHTRIEVSKTINDNKIWIDADYYKKNPYFDKDDEDEKEWEVVEICRSRNYQLFSVLANVRNYSKDDFISKPRGIPIDSNKSIKEDYEIWKSDAHSASYFTLRDLIEARDRFKKTKYSGMVSPDDAKLIDDGEMPETWSKSTTIESHVYREWEIETDILKNMVEELTKRLQEILYVWDGEVVEQSSNIRIVFWFDN